MRCVLCGGSRTLLLSVVGTTCACCVGRAARRCGALTASWNCSTYLLLAGSCADPLFGLSDIAVGRRAHRRECQELRAAATVAPGPGQPHLQAAASQSPTPATAAAALVQASDAPVGSGPAEPPPGQRGGGSGGVRNVVVVSAVHGTGGGGSAGRAASDADLAMAPAPPSLLPSPATDAAPALSGAAAAAAALRLSPRPRPRPLSVVAAEGGAAEGGALFPGDLGPASPVHSLRTPHSPAAATAQPPPHVTEMAAATAVAVAGPSRLEEEARVLRSRLQEAEQQNAALTAVVGQVIVERLAAQWALGSKMTDTRRQHVHNAACALTSRLCVDAVGNGKDCPQPTAGGDDHQCTCCPERHQHRRSSWRRDAGRLSGRTGGARSTRTTLAAVCLVCFLSMAACSVTQFGCDSQV